MSNYFSKGYINHDTAAGVITNRGGSRLCFLSEDFLIGFKEALVEETGDAYNIVFKTCGKYWGELFIKRLSKEVETFYNKSINDLSILKLNGLFESLWLEHGWGEISIDWKNAHNSGVFEIEIKNSAFPDIFAEKNKLNDDIMSGLLSAILSHFSQKEMVCHQTQYIVLENQPTISKFIAVVSERAANIPDMVSEQKSHREIFKQLVN